jgi:hypothetical protein
MKNVILKATFIAIAPLLVTEALAQCPSNLRAEIPFDFTLNDKQIKAGNYTLEKLDCNTATPLVVLRDAEGRSLGIVNRSATPIGSPKAREQGTLTFVRYGDAYYLSEVRDPLRQYSFRLRSGKKERLLARSSQRNTVSVSVATSKNN